MATHDPLKYLGDLRDHIARHDKPIAFLFGAGTSAAVNAATPPSFKSLIPAVAALTADCKTAVDAMGDPFKAAFIKLEDECVSTTGSVANIEDILSKVRGKKDAVGVGEKLAGLTRDDFTKLELTIRETIVKAVHPSLSSYPAELPHYHFAQWIRHATRSRPIEIFTTNYDLLIEQALENAHIPVFDGFVGSCEPFFLADSVERDELIPGAGWVRLWKIHGSINWNVKQHAGSSRILRTHVAGAGQMILPSHLKYDESRKQPYLTLLSRLGRVLNQEDTILVTCGYSFSDQHVNAVLFSALETRTRSHIIALHHGDLDPKSTLFEYAKRIHNLVVIAKNGAVIGTKWAEWSLASLPDGDAQAFLAIAFDCVTPAAPTTSPLSGAMRLGDFNCFCRFLASLTGNRV